MIFEKIKQLCEKYEISISSLEKKCNLGNSTVRGWKTSYPSVENLKKVANYFNLPVDYFLEDEKDEVNYHSKTG